MAPAASCILFLSIISSWIFSLMAPAASCILFLSIFSLAFTLVPDRPTQSNISLEASLHPSTNPTSWLSSNGRFAFGFYLEGTGFYIGIWLVASPKNTTVIWTADRDAPPVTKDAVLKLTNEGLKLLLQQSEGRLISQISTNADAFSASMLDSGNFVIYDSKFNVVWQTFDYPTDTIMAGQVLPCPAGNKLVSSASETNHSSGRFQLIMQTDGNLVLYPVASPDSPGDAYWASGTDGEDYQSLNLDVNGWLHLIKDNGTYNLTDGLRNGTAVVYRATLGVDGILRLYSHDLELNTEQALDNIPNFTDPCEVKGTCGLNSYCASADGQVACWCLPGFYYLDTNRIWSGCRGNFTTSGCSLNGDNTTYMSPLEDVTWMVDSYTAPLSVSSEEDCREACLKDCNCDATLFQGSGCSKLALPLRYGLRDSAAITFIKLVNISAGGRRDGSHAERSPTAAPLISAKQKFSATILNVSVAIVAGIICTLAALVFFFYRYRAERCGRMGRNREAALADEITPRAFSYHELMEATDGFKEELGRGAFGTVFKGTLPSGEKVIAVKKLEKVVDEGEREFRTEMRTIGRTHHKNLVRLLGFCDEGTNRLLVYEYMSNGSLADLIFKADGHPDWDKRVRIAFDIARGIHYLHEECETRIIHCDIKPQNILIDDNLRAKISDFGLAKLLMPSQTRTFTGIRGTRGYLAPEWHKNAPITVKADVYSFGIVLLEIVCCRKNMELEAEVDAIVLLDWVYECFVTGELEKLIPDEVDIAELNRLVKVGLSCTQSEPAFRPAMKNVVMMPEGNIDVSLPPPPNSSS